MFVKNPRTLSVKEVLFSALKGLNIRRIVLNDIVIFT